MPKTIISAGLSLLLFCTTLITNTYAEPTRQYNYPDHIVITSPKCNEFTFDATESFFAPGEHVSFLWDFGDENTSVDPIINHTYQASGDYKVSLSVIDNSGFTCSSARTTRHVRAIVPVHAAFKSDEAVCTNEPVLFDAIGSSAEENKTLKYTWDFGDGTIVHDQSKVVKEFVWGGEYDVSLTVDDQSGHACGQETIVKTIDVNEPPKAQAGDDVLFKCIHDAGDMAVHFTAEQSSDRNDDILSYHWDFGDGRQSMGQEVIHHYANPGQYEVKLIASDNTNLKCSSDIDFITVNLSYPLQANAGDDITICSGDQIDFDGTQSFIDKKGTVIAKWFLGDGITKQGLKVKHRYARPGTYEAMLTLDNKLNNACPISRDTRLIRVKAAPNIDIKNIGEECVDTKVQFDATSSLDPDGNQFTYNWNFGDGTTIEGGAKISHEYSRGGDYPVSVKIDDNKNTPCSKSIAWTNIKINTQPIAHAGSNFACCVDEETAFSAEHSEDIDGDRLTYNWDFGDGTRKRGKVVSHAYRQKGSFNVTLTVDDHSGTSCSRASDGFVAKVKEFPLPIISIK